jgi:hypothetical protein
MVGTSKLSVAKLTKMFRENFRDGESGWDKAREYARLGRTMMRVKRLISRVRR